ncbi:hypothetical protein ABEB36_003172 [Hypothenemus hampei]|uniref:SH3 domain-containing protein n=1 Tax=Hypothenemus hampei TaxID=57062 RepID=A0ABD1FBF1_HYPHA
MVDALVEFEYAAQEPDELTIKKGDIIKNVIQKPGGWWEGSLHDKKGVFPENYVKLLDKDAVILRNKKELSRPRQCKVTFSYTQEHEDELTLKVGDIIDILGEEEEGWWRGVLNGKEGVFPSNFVEEIKPSEIKSKQSNREDKLNEQPPPLPAKPVKQLCEARFSYEAQKSDELTLKEGDVITILNKDGQDPGWWKGEINGKIGVFPDNFVTILPQVHDDKKPSSSNKNETKSSEVSAIKPSSVALQRKSLEGKSTPPTKLSETKTPPLPAQKPASVTKKSPSSSSLFSKLKDKFVDAVDGSSGSKQKQVESPPEATIIVNVNVNAFDQVERRPLLNDVRANRVRAPGRRLPTSILKDEDEVEENVELLNGNVAKSEHSVKSEDSFKSEGSVSSENFDLLSSDLDANETKPKLREWEKHRAPWLEEMKLNQAKRTSVSPVPDSKAKHDPEPSKSSQNSPADKEINLGDMSKSMSEIKMSPMEVKPIPKPNNELEKAPPIKSSIPKESPSKPSSATQPLKMATKPKLEQYENVSIQKPIPSVKSPPSSGPKPSLSSQNLAEKSKNNNNTTSSSNKTDLSQILERLTKLELRCEKQEQMIEDLRNRLQVETEMRMILQEKVMRNSVQQV